MRRLAAAALVGILLGAIPAKTLGHAEAQIPPRVPLLSYNHVPEPGDPVGRPVKAASKRTKAPKPGPLDLSDALLACVLRIESRGNYAAISAPGMCSEGDRRCYGGYQWSHDAWFANFPGRLPKDVPPAEQDELARKWIARRGLQPWPTPNRRCR